VNLLIVVFVGLCRVMFRSAFTVDENRAAGVMALDEGEAISDRWLLVVSVGVLAVVTAAFVLHSVLHLEPSIVAVVGGLGLLALSRLDAADVARDVEWPTLVFFTGLFIMVGALVNTGVIDRLARAAAESAEGHLAWASLGLLWGSAAVSGLVDNIPYVATMSPVVAELVAAEGGGPHARSLWWALALGADLGGNATAVGASANVVILGLAEKAGYRIGFWGFTKYGLIVAATTIAVSTPYVVLRYFVLA
jgi:Na+/H+ antiporter NhaD/arsenite permease-like protein